LSDGLQYYKDLEKTLQKTLVVAEKAAEETKNASISKANAIEQTKKKRYKIIISKYI
ncbi:DivIVA domain-containing protein, partial [Velocimicrobium porci]|nr:DivIVA domain-containing protein [Velocimicrobium porci]